LAIDDGGGRAGFSFALLPITGKKGQVIYLIGVLVLASGGFGGFYITHNDPGDYNNATFRQTLMDPNSWSESAKTIRDCDLLAKIKTGALADDSSCGELLKLLRDRQRAQ
jgi:hypothetical protein